MALDTEVDGTALISFGFIDDEELLSALALITFGFVTGFHDIWTNIDTPITMTWTVIDT